MNKIARDAATSTGVSKLVDKLVDAVSPLTDPVFGTIKRAAVWLRRKISRNPAYSPEVKIVPEDAPPDDLLIILPSGV